MQIGLETALEVPPNPWKDSPTYWFCVHEGLKQTNKNSHLTNKRFHPLYLKKILQIFSLLYSHSNISSNNKCTPSIYQNHSLRIQFLYLFVTSYLPLSTKYRPGLSKSNEVYPLIYKVGDLMGSFLTTIEILTSKLILGIQISHWPKLPLLMLGK